MSVKDAINYRKAIKLYDESKSIKDSDLKTIIEAGRLAPSSNGLEPVKIVVIKNKELKAKAAEYCFMAGNHDKVKQAPVVALLLATNSEYLPSKEFLSNRLGRFANGTDLENKIEGMAKYIKSTYNDIAMFADEQAHITSAYMSLQAADLKIGSSTMGGITPKEAEQFFVENKIADPKQYHLALGMAFGYYNEKTPGTYFPRVRISEEEFVKIYE